MKKLIYSIAIITLFSTVTSCTVDELEPVKKTNTTSTSTFSKDGDIIPPPPVPTPLPK